MLRIEIQRVYNEHHLVYGPRKVWKQRRRERIRAARCTVGRVMRSMGLAEVVRGRAWITTTHAGADGRSSDLVDRQFVATRRNQGWVSDFPYVATWSGFVYVAFVIDVFARRIVGWRVSASMHTDFVLDGLEQAIHVRSGDRLTGLVHHPDRGTQYLSMRYTDRLGDAGIAQSVGSQGDAFDNALAEGCLRARIVEREPSGRSVLMLTQLPKIASPGAPNNPAAVDPLTGAGSSCVARSIVRGTRSFLHAVYSDWCEMIKPTGNMRGMGVGLTVVMLVLSVAFIRTAQTDSAITVDPARVFQTMEGFGSSERVFDDPHVTETFDASTQRSAVVLTMAEQDEILDRLYVELGLTRVRPTTEASIEPANDNGNPNATDLSRFDFSWKKTDAHIDYVKRAVARGARTFFLSPLKIETWMGRTSAGDVAEYVEWAMAQLRRWREAGVELPFYSVLNEPGNGNIMSGAFIRDVIKLMGPILDREGFATRFIVTDDLGPAEAYERCAVILEDAAARRYVAAVATHLYTSRDLTQLASLAKRHGLPLWMTEYFRSESGHDPFMYATLMNDLMTKYDVSAVDYMWGFFGAWESGTQLISIRYNDRRFDGFDPRQGSAYRGYQLDKMYFTLGQFSRYVRPGAQRVAALSSDGALSVSAYRSDSDLVVIVVNASLHELSGTISLADGSVLGQVSAVRTTPTEDWRALPDQVVSSPTTVASFPAKSVTTFVIRQPRP